MVTGHVITIVVKERVLIMKKIDEFLGRILMDVRNKCIDK